MKIAIYLAGSIQKGHEKHESYWTADDMEFLKKSLSHHEISFLNPAFRTDNLSDSLSVFGRDMLQVFCSDIVFVDARDRRGLGVGAEMMWAKFNQTPVVVWAPKDTHYNKTSTTLLGVRVDNFIHPFIEALSDAIVGDLAEGAKWIEKTLSDPTRKVKGVEFIRSAIEHYKASQLHNDKPMLDLLAFSEALQHRAHT